MKIGDIIECTGGHHAVVMGLEMLYPHHPDSPIRNIEVFWLNDTPKYSWKIGPKVYKVNIFSFKRILDHNCL